MFHSFLFSETQRTIISGNYTFMRFSKSVIFSKKTKNTLKNNLLDIIPNVVIIYIKLCK